MEHIFLENLLRHMEGREVLKAASAASQGQVLPDQLGEESPSMDKERAIYVIYLDFCKAFDTVPHNTLLSKLERDGLDGWTI